MVESNNAINNTIGASINGVTNTFSVTNPSDTANSSARGKVTVGGSSAGDPSLNFNVNGITDFEMGIDNSDDDALIISSGTSLGTNNTWRMSSSGQRTMPLQPAFSVFKNGSAANVTGDGTTYTIALDSKTFDQGNDFDTGTFTFTSPVTGKYALCAQVILEGVTASHVTGNGNIVTTKANLRFGEVNFANVRNPSSALSILGTFITDMDAGDTATLTIRVAGGAQVVGVQASSTLTKFMGWLVA